MDQIKKNANAYNRGLFRYTVLSPLLASPPRPGELAAYLREIAAREHMQPWDQQRVKISFRTLERWYSLARKSSRPTEALQPKLRCDRQATRALSLAHKEWIGQFYREYPSWSVQLLFDNLCAANLPGTNPSYSTVLRYFRACGFFPHKSRVRHRNRKEIRSYEVEYVGQLWHMDFHKGSRMVLTSTGEFVQPICMAIIDDKSRLVCHAQWFLNKTAEVLVHGFCQAIAKRGMPATFYTDNGSAMKATELVTGLEVLGINQEYTLPYAAYQNGKQESFWKPLEGRLLKMIPKQKRIDLELLNKVTQAWVEQDYHTSVHSETKQTPLHRFFDETGVLRPALDFNELKRCFRMRLTRSVRKTDATVTIDGVRFQLPQCYGHLDQIVLRYARWDLGEAEVLCPDTLKPIATIYPVNKLANSLANRSASIAVAEQTEDKAQESEELLSLSHDWLPPLLARCLADHARENQLAGYLPLNKESKPT